MMFSYDANGMDAWHYKLVSEERIVELIEAHL